jgi:hypothetical protein
MFWSFPRSSGRFDPFGKSKVIAKKMQRGHAKTNHGGAQLENRINPPYPSARE